MSRPRPLGAHRGVAPPPALGVAGPLAARCRFTRGEQSSRAAALGGLAYAATGRGRSLESVPRVGDTS